MAFASIYVPDFSIQAVVRAEPALRQRALALVEGCPPLERVVAINEAAARAKLDLGMTKAQAAQFPSIVIRQRSPLEEQSSHAALLDLGWSVSPRVEDTAADSIVVDLAGLASLFGSEEAIANLLAQRAFDFGLVVQVAVSSNLEVALHAARGFPGVTVIPPGEESGRLGVLPIQVFSPPVEIMETLERWGVRTCEALAKLPLLELSERLGQQGVQLHQWARGTSVRSMILAQPKLCFEEEMALEYAIEELDPLAFLLGRLLDQLCARLSARSLSACALHLRFELDNSSANEASPANIPNQHPDEKPIEKKVYEKLFTLPVSMRDSKMLLRLLCLHVQSDPPRAPIVRIFLGAESAAPRVRQEGLFLPSSPDPEKLELTIARLANVVGNSNVGSPRLIDSHRPDAFEMSRFIASQNASEVRQKSLIAPQGHEPVAAFRVFRPAPRAKVALREGRPVHISFPNMHGEVIAASGPWRTSGEWWREDAWHREEWDVEVHRPAASKTNLFENSPSAEPQNGVYRIYFDDLRQAWFVAGMYD